MTQKVILCELAEGKDLLESSPVAALIANGYEVTGVSGFSTKDNRNMSYVLLTKPDAEQEKAATPMFSITSEGMLSLNSATVGADIYYTTDGNDPSSSATRYTEPVTLTATTTVKAVAVKSDMADSDVATFTYTVIAAATEETT